jgi:GNAT superfamily N-acetyltransferase
VEIIRDEFPSELLPYTIFGCHGIERYLRDTIAHQNWGNSAWYVLCAEDSRADGFVEIRRTIHSLFTNHLYIASSARGPGVGTSLWFHGLNWARNPEQSSAGCDVFDSIYAVRRRRHRALGFQHAFEQLWVEAAPDDWGNQDAHTWYAGGLALADRIHENYGFSEFDLHTRSNRYRIGRLGRRFFRATDAAVFSDPSVPHALRTLDPRRSLFCVDKTDRLCGVPPENATLRARSVRMTADVDEVLERLSRFRTF